MAETTHAVQQITDAEFESIVNAGKPVFVDFWAPWCGPCRIIGPIVEELAPSYQDKAVITKMNVDYNRIFKAAPDVIAAYGEFFDRLLREVMGDAPDESRRHVAFAGNLPIHL